MNKVMCNIIISISFLYSDPAQALQMPQETYLPTGMVGVVTCPVVAQPPLLRVDWTKDGEPLDLSLVIKIIISTWKCSHYHCWTLLCAQTQISVPGQLYVLFMDSCIHDKVPVSKSIYLPLAETCQSLLLTARHLWNDGHQQLIVQKLF